MAQIYQDIDLFGEENTNGTPKEYFDKDALKNSITFWLMSKKGDYIEAPQEGGVIDFALFKNMTGEMEEIIKFRIETAFSLYFTGVAEIVDIIITPNYTQRYTEIDISYKDLINGVIDSITVYPTSSTKAKRFTYTEIEFVEENLFTYVKLTKPDMLDQKLVYNLNENVWIWGNRFKFVNFDFSDPYFDTILEYINVL